MTPPVRPDPAPADDRARILGNVQRMRGDGATDAEVEHYLTRIEHLTPGAPGAASAPAAPSAPGAPIENHYGWDGGRSFGENLRDMTREVLGQGAALGWGDEIEAAPRALLSGQSYDQALAQIRGQLHDFEAGHPAVAALGKLGGMLGPGLAAEARGPAGGPAGGPARALTPLQKAGKAAATGAVYGGLTSAGEQDGSLGDRLTAGLVGAGTGLAGGATLSLLGQGIAGAARAYQLGPKALAALAAVTPVASWRTALEQAGRAAMDRGADRAYATRLGQDGVTPAQARADAAAVHPDIPIAAADLGGENVRRMTGAVKRLPGPQKAAIAQTLETRVENAPSQMLASLQRNAPEASAALGIPATAGVDTRLANPDEFLATARAALGSRMAPRYETLLAQPVTYDDAALADVGRLLQRPSMTQYGIPFAEKIAGEADQRLGALPTGAREVPHASGLLDATGAPLTATAPTGRAPAPTAPQLHWLNMGLGRRIADVEDQIARADAMGDPARGLRTDLHGLLQTRAQLLGATNTLLDGYGALTQDYATEARPLDAFRQGMGLSPITPPRQVETRIADATRQGTNANAQTALGGGYARRLMDDVQRAANTTQSPARVVVGTGSDASSKTLNLRALLGAHAAPIEADASALDRMHQTAQQALGGSPTAENLGEDAALSRVMRAVHAVAHSRPVAAVDALLGGEYGPQSQALANRLMLGAQPGQRTRLLDWLGALDQAQPGTVRRLFGTLAPRGTGIVAGAGAAGITASP